MEITSKLQSENWNKRYLTSPIISSQSRLKSTAFSADNLLTSLKTLPVAGRYCIAYSGGLDSHVLLHAFQSIKSHLPADIFAFHVNHGINSQADKWALHCERTCKALGVNFRLLKIEGSCPRGESSEAWARQQRYQLLSSELEPEDLLITAHHQDDQAETVLLQLARGAGVKGLAAMPILKKRNNIWHARPLLNVSREHLQEYAKRHQLEWVEDESNKDHAIDRNFFRAQILPVLKQRWPNIAETLGRAASHQAEAVIVQDEIAEMDMQTCAGQTEQQLNIEKLQLLSSPRQANLIRYWLRRLDLPVPDTGLMQEILTKLLTAKVDAEPLIRWSGTELKRYQQQIYASEPTKPFNNSDIIDWDLTSPCYLDSGVLNAKQGEGPGIRVDICEDSQLQIRFRQGGEKIQLKNKGHRQELKKLFQEAGIPPWLRDRIPLIYRDNNLIAVAGLWVDSSACNKEGEQAWLLDWSALADEDPGFEN